MTITSMELILRNFLRRTLVALFAVLAVALAGSGGAMATEAPDCAGSDLLQEIARNDPAAHKLIMAEAGAVPNGQALLWRIDGASGGKNAGKPSWLFGTIHVTDERVNAMTPEIKAALNGSDAIAIEIAGLGDGEAAMAAAMQSMMGSIIFTDGRRLSDYLSDDEAERLGAALGNAGLPAAMGEVLQPWFASIMLALPSCEFQRAAAGLKALDFRIEAEAKARGAAVHGLETTEEQFEAMAGLPFESQLAWLKASIILYDRAPDLLETMVQLYLDRQISAVWPLNVHIAIAGGESREAVELAMAEFQLRLVEVRNYRMAERALPLIEAGGAFIAVGAAHLPGKVGLVELVRKAGYTVTAAE